jgi:hypothetical protein
MGLQLIAFKHHLNLANVSDTTNDIRYQQLLDRAEKIIIGKLGYDFNLTTVTSETHDPRVYICPKVQPILTTPVPVVKQDGTTLTVTSDYWVYERYFYLPYLRGYDEPQSINLAYTGGYADTSEDILPYWTLIFETAQYWLKLHSELQPGTLLDYRLPNEVKELLVNYMVVSFG